MAEIKQLRLSTVESSRKSFARIIRAYHSKELDEQTFKTLVYGLSHYLSYWKLEKDIEIEKRLDTIEERLK